MTGRVLHDDTIAAIATAAGSGAVGIVRLSGPDAAAIGRRLFDRPLRPRRATFGRVRHPGTSQVLDTCLAIYMPGPRSYTGEDVLEFQGHGGSRSLQRLLAAVLAAGARAAEPGEFSLRAFLGGRMDLTQAEAVLALVESRTDEAASQAMAALEGRSGGLVRAARAAALELVAYLGARADFPDEDVPPRDLLPDLQALQQQLELLLRGASLGVLRREGVQIALVGLPNAGKSSLLNRLLGVPRAIVGARPGTTRDTIEESANILGVPVRITDTAGIRMSHDPVEREGVERSRAATRRSDLALVVIDAGVPGVPELGELLSSLGSRPRVLVLNKIDLGRKLAQECLPAGERIMPVSALTGEGVEELERTIYELVAAGALHDAEPPALFTLRQQQAAGQAFELVRSAIEGLDRSDPEDLLAIDLMSAVRVLGELTGEDATEQLLDTIFQRFCIGK